MGIPYYFYTLTKTYHNILSDKLPFSNIDIYCLDFNGIIHPVCAKIIPETIDENIIIKSLYEKVLLDIEKIKPKHTMICIDGIVPLAKMMQQRKRRYLSVLRNKIDNLDIKWDTNAITPGTEFMNNLNNYFKKMIRYNSTDSNIIFSGSDEYGEGEHKIFTKLKSVDENAYVMINGLDADLIILSLMSHRKNIILMRESETCTYLNIDVLRSAILEELNKKWNIPQQLDIYSKEAQDIIETYCVMCSLLGNDFIPHILTLNLKQDGLNKLLNITGIVYQTHGLIVNNGIINYIALSDIIQNISKTEDKDLYKEVEKYLKFFVSKTNIPSEFYGVKHKDTLASAIYANISNWRQNYYKHLFNTNIIIDSSILSSACYHYIYGIYWTYAYYKKMDYDSEWFYPYSYPPSIKDISNYMLGNIEPPIMNKKDIEFDTDIQLMIVLPKESIYLMKDTNKRFMTDKQLGLYHLYPDKYKIHTFLKTHLWECTPELPMININKIKILKMKTI